MMMMPNYSMAYGKKKRGRGSSFVRRRSMYSRIPRKRRSYASVGAKRKTRMVEHKFLDGLVGPITALTAGVFLSTSHNFVPQGFAENERIGRKITIKSLEVRGSIVLPPTETLGNMDNRVRIIFYIDHQTNGAAATLDEIVNTSGTVSINAFRDLANQQRFRLIYDTWFDLPVRAVLQDAATTGDNVPSSTGFKFVRKLNLSIQFDDGVTTGAISSQRTNNIGAFCICEQTSVAPIVAYTFRIRYTDA